MNAGMYRLAAYFVQHKTLDSMSSRQEFRNELGASVDPKDQKILRKVGQLSGMQTRVKDLEAEVVQLLQDRANELEPD